MEEEYIKQIFGLKLRQIRTEKKLSLFGLSKLTGLSKSYLNEIEKGKKYPKTDKVLLLADKLEIPYDYLVSLKLDKNLAPIGDLLKSNILKEIPLEIFGIKEGNLIDIVSNAPAKVTAFISTIIEIAHHYNFSRENFFLASLRSYQEANNNYFEELEEEAKRFKKAYPISADFFIESKELEEVLVEELGYRIEDGVLDKYKELKNLRSIFIAKHKTLLLSSEIEESQKAFIYAKELAYHFLKIENRLFTFPWVSYKGFDPLLNNFKASYFASALLISKEKLVSQLRDLFQEKVFDQSLFLKMLQTYNASPETFYQRLTNILPKEFQIQDLFFLRFSYEKGKNNFELTKEFHLSHQHSPRANETNEHYCRRWVSLKVLQDISYQAEEHIFDMQISDYVGKKTQYLVLTSASKHPFKANQYRSISIGLLLNKALLKKIKFLKDKKIITREVGVTCERCPISDCEVRQNPPLVLTKAEQHQSTKKTVAYLMNNFSPPANTTL